jgi:DNA invertase Pin-like site-specific DNA recombinase
MSEEQGWRLIVTEIGIDTRTPIGKAMAHMAVVFAELERDFIRARLQRKGRATLEPVEPSNWLRYPTSGLADL